MYLGLEIMYKFQQGKLYNALRSHSDLLHLESLFVNSITLHGSHPTTPVRSTENISVRLTDAIGWIYSPLEPCSGSRLFLQ